MKTALTSLWLATALLGSPLQAATVAYYEFDGLGTAALGSTIADSIGGHHGTVTGGDLVYGLDPSMGSYLRFAADAGVGNPGNRVEVPGSSAFVFALNQAFTIETIFRTTQTVVNGVLISKGCDVSNPDSQWWLRHQGNGQLRGLVEGVDNTVEDNATSAAGSLYNDGLWHHVAVVYDVTGASKHLDIYVDSVLKGSDTAIGTLGLIGGTDADPMIFGEFASLVANRSFEGDLAAIRLSDTPLVPTDFLVVPEPTLASFLIVGLLCAWTTRRKVQLR
jgi:hypothetical protein